jgi:PAS domain S-box-containing protein
MQVRSRLVMNYLAAVLSVGTCTALRAPLLYLMGIGVGPFTLVYPAVLLSGWIGGLGPGLLATALAAASALYLFVGPSSGSQISNGRIGVRLAGFLIVSVFTSLVNEALKRAREAERRHREWLEVTLTSIGDAVIAADLKGRVTFINPVARALTGWGLDDALGMPLSTVFDIADASTHRRVEGPAEKILREGVVVGLANHTVLISKDGRKIPIDDSGAPIRGADGSVAGVIIVFQDITERVQAQEAQLIAQAQVRENEQRFRLAATNKDITLFEQDLDLKYVWVYPNHPEFPEGNIGKSDKDLLPSEEAGLLTRLKTSVIETGFDTRREIKISLPGGARWYDVILRPRRDNKGDIVGLAGVAVDITDRKRAEEERERALERERNARNQAEEAQKLAAELLAREQAARSDAEAASRSKDEFLATVSHELRTPLNAVLGWARVLRGSKLDPETAARAIEVIEKNARAQAQLIEDLLDVSRIVAGKLRITVRPIDLAAVINAAIDVVRPAADAKGIALSVGFGTDSGFVSGDADRLQQVIWNLLSNGVKFTPNGGRVWVTLRRIEGYVDVFVNDTGQGIDPAFLPFVFDRFRQADASLTRSHSGLGLGLAIVRHLVELHGGAVSVDSQGIGLGTTLTVRLPSAAGPESQQEPLFSTIIEGQRSSVPSPERSGPLSGVRILVVEDEPDGRELVASILRRCEAEVQVAANAAEALMIMGTWRADVLVSDIEMPGMDGYELIERLRSQEKGRPTKTAAVALTAHATVHERHRALSAGYQAHIAKPLEPTELIAIIAGLLPAPNR